MERDSRATPNLRFDRTRSDPAGFAHLHGRVNRDVGRHSAATYHWHWPPSSRETTWVPIPDVAAVE